MRLKLLEQNIRRDFANNIWHEKNSQGGIILVASLNIQFLLQSQNRRVTNIHTIRMRRGQSVRDCRKVPYIDARGVPTDQGKRANRAHTSMARHANQSWPSIGARWYGREGGDRGRGHSFLGSGPGCDLRPRP